MYEVNTGSSDFCNTCIIQINIDQFFILTLGNFRLFLHYHDYIIDGRWVLTQDIDSNDETAVVRNRGDGLDDEECPEKETFGWELRSKRAPGMIML